MLRRVASAFGACALRVHSPALHQQNNIGSVRYLRGNARRVAVVLLDDNISRKGDAGDVIEVRPGYARNKLIPQKLAKYATPENVAQFGKAALEAAATAATTTTAATTPEEDDDATAAGEREEQEETEAVEAPKDTVA